MQYINRKKNKYNSTSMYVYIYIYRDRHLHILHGCDGNLLYLGLSHPHLGPCGPTLRREDADAEFPALPTESESPRMPTRRLWFFFEYKKNTHNNNN